MENVDWKTIPFGYRTTAGNVRCSFKNGKWGEIRVTDSEQVTMHMAATCLHYGQEAFEGMKAYRRPDGKVQVFRWEENAKRLIRSAEGIQMEPVTIEIFKEAVFKAIEINADFVPPFGHGATLYIRPILLGTSAEVGVKPSKEYEFIVFVTPVGPYYPAGFKPVDVMISRYFDRSAPLGTGSYKVGGNYAASLNSIEDARNKGYATALYLDPKEKRYIDECGPANFFGIKGDKFVTPKSDSILPSITNKSLMELAEWLGMEVEQRPVPLSELESFEEVGQCGTAAVISPIDKIFDPEENKIYSFCENGVPGKTSTKLYEQLNAIQFGEIEDPFGWTEIVF